MSLAEFVEKTIWFEVHAMRVDGRVCGALLIDGNEIHACIESWAVGKWFGRQAAAILNSVIDYYGEAITRATTGKGVDFVLALGFVKDGEIYRSTKKWVLNRSSAQQLHL